MATRRLALNLNQALRSRAALKSIQPIKRGFATPIHQGINTESTTLSNGLTVSIPQPSRTRHLICYLDSNRAFSMGANLDRWRLD